ncbi:unnamed protein product [Effrenium voratum]|nr:unnamed protein product [Effrenium voratum]
MADLLQERMVDSRNVVEEAVWLDKRNSLFFLLLNILNNNRPFEKIPTSPTEEDEGLEEPLWKIVAARPPLDSSERQENAGASHVEMLAKAKEEGAAAVEKAVPPCGLVACSMVHVGFRGLRGLRGLCDQRSLRSLLGVGSSGCLAQPPRFARSWRLVDAPRVAWWVELCSLRGSCPPSVPGALWPTSAGPARRGGQSERPVCVDGVARWVGRRGGPGL